MAFKSQDNIRSSIFGDNKIDYSTDNLFTGTWRLDQNNLNRFDPFLTGFAGIVWTKLPIFWEHTKDTSITTQFKMLTERNFKSFSGLSDMTLDSDQMSTGFAGNELPFATNLKKENTSFTLKHYELAGSPIRELYQYWITGIRDMDNGTADYHGAIESGDLVYSAKNHTAELLYVVTDASFAVGGASGIEYACYYTNVFPTKIPQDHLNYSSGDHASVEIDQEFKGCFHISADVNALAVATMANYKFTKGFGDYATNVSTSDTMITTGYGA